jgi:hypothetical protein
MPACPQTGLIANLGPFTPYFLKMGIDKVWTGLQVLDIQPIFYGQLYCWAQKETRANSSFNSYGLVPSLKTGWRYLKIVCS